jgi:hypothetical protein
MGRSFGKSVRPYIKLSVGASLVDVLSVEVAIIRCFDITAARIVAIVIAGALQQRREPVEQCRDLLRLEHRRTNQQPRRAAGHEQRIVLHPRFDVVRIRTGGVRLGLKQRRPLVKCSRIHGGGVRGIRSHARPRNAWISRAQPPVRRLFEGTLP